MCYVFSFFVAQVGKIFVPCNTSLTRITSELPPWFESCSLLNRPGKSNQFLWPPLLWIFIQLKLPGFTIGRVTHAMNTYNIELPTLPYLIVYTKDKSISWKNKVCCKTDKHCSDREIGIKIKSIHLWKLGLASKLIFYGKCHGIRHR